LTQERAFWLAWSQIPGIGSILIRRLHHHFGTLEAAWAAELSDLAAVDGVGRQSAASIIHERRKLSPAELLEQHQTTNPHFWTLADPTYPRLLLEIPDPPPILYFRGRVDLLENQGLLPAIAIVGTRKPSDYGRRWTRKLSAILTQAGFTVVSGLAEGVDTEAHHTCLAAEGRTIAVLGTGVDVIYPWFNRKLAEQIVSQGLLLSEHPAGTQPDRPNFPRRNRIIAGLCRATLIMEAPERSGALITARFANDYGREVYALPGSLDNPRSKGCLGLLNQGAQVILGEQELLDGLGMLPKLQPLKSATGSSAFLPSSTQLTVFAEEPLNIATLAPELQQVLQAMPLEPITLDHLVEQTGLAAGTVLSALSQLELMDLVSLLPGMQYQRGLRSGHNDQF
jgi:DNA processing protein